MSVLSHLIPTTCCRMPPTHTQSSHGCFGGVGWCLRRLIFPHKTAITSFETSANSKKHVMKTRVHVRMVSPYFAAAGIQKGRYWMTSVAPNPSVIQVSFQLPPQPEALHRWSRRHRLALDVCQSWDWSDQEKWVDSSCRSGIVQGTTCYFG